MPLITRFRAMGGKPGVSRDRHCDGEEPAYKPRTTAVERRLCVHVGLQICCFLKPVRAGFCHLCWSRVPRGKEPAGCVYVRRETHVS